MTDFSMPEGIFEALGVTRLPMPLSPPRMNDLYPREYLGSGKSSPVLVSMDLSAAGEVERVEAILPPYLDGKVKVRAVLLGPGDARREYEPAAGRELDPLFARAAEAAVREMRFSPAELKGEPVPFHGYRMTLVFSDPESAARE